jgi:hypothetical protein
MPDPQGFVNRTTTNWLRILSESQSHASMMAIRLAEFSGTVFFDSDHLPNPCYCPHKTCVPRVSIHIHLAFRDRDQPGLHVRHSGLSYPHIVDKYLGLV